MESNAITQQRLSKALTKQPRRLVIPNSPQTLTTIPTGISHVAQEGRPRTARKPKVPLGSYVLPSPAPASAAAFLTDIGIRPFSQNTYQTQSSSSQTPAPSLRPAHCTTDTPSRPEAFPGLPTTEDGETGKFGAPLSRLSPGCPLPARAPQSGKSEQSCRVVVVPAPCPPRARPPQGAGSLRAPSRGARPRAPEGAPCAPEV